MNSRELELIRAILIDSSHNEVEDFLKSELDLLDSKQAAEFVGRSVGSMRQPNGLYRSIAVKLGDYLYWRRSDLECLLSRRTNRYQTRQMAYGNDWIFLYEVDVKSYYIGDGQGHVLARMEREGLNVNLVSANHSLWHNGRVLTTLGYCRKIFIEDEGREFVGYKSGSLKKWKESANEITGILYKKHKMLSWSQ